MVIMIGSKFSKLGSISKDKINIQSNIIRTSSSIELGRPELLPYKPINNPIHAEVKFSRVMMRIRDLKASISHWPILFHSKNV
jgi:hypothetical protein